MFIDSHCHLDRLDLSPYQGDLGLALDAARQAGVDRMLNTRLPGRIQGKRVLIECSVSVLTLIMPRWW